jgi:hypothetical protein
MISDEERSNPLTVAKKSISLTDQCKLQLGLSGEGSSKQYRRIRQAIKYSCEGMIPIYTHLKILFRSHVPGVLTREGLGVKRLTKLLKVCLRLFS